MSIDRRLLAGVLGLTMIVAACSGSSASPAASAAASSAASTEPAASEAASQAPSEAAASEEPSEDNGPQVTYTAGAAADLESKLPDSVNGIALTKSSVNGEKINTLGTNFDTSDIGTFLKANGKSLSDVKAAQAQSASSTSLDKFMLLFAIQVQGLDASKWESQITKNMDSLTDATVGGKSVKESAGPPTTIVYPNGDTIYMVLAGTADNANAALAALP